MSSFELLIQRVWRAYEVVRFRVLVLSAELTKLAVLASAKKDAWEQQCVVGQRSVPLLARYCIAIMNFRTGIRQNDKERGQGGESSPSFTPWQSVLIVVRSRRIRRDRIIRETNPATARRTFRKRYVSSTTRGGYLMI